MRIGAASKKVVDSATLKPLIIIPRATGMFPHSQTGMNVPNKEIEKRLRSGRFGSSWIIRCVETKRRIAVETKAPRMTNGRASMTTLNVKVMKSCSLLGNERLEASVPVAFNHSKSAVINPNITKSTRKRATARLPNLMACAFCSPTRLEKSFGFLP